MTKQLIVSLSWVSVLVWMTLIFILSSQPAGQSGDLSKGVAEFFVGSIESEDDAFIYKANHLVRKNAHLFTYMILGFLVMNALRRSGMSGNGAIALSFGICALFAGSDEVHQLFVAGRGALAKDVIIDCVGALLGIVIYILVLRVIKR